MHIAQALGIAILSLLFVAGLCMMQLTGLSTEAAEQVVSGISRATAVSGHRMAWLDGNILQL